MKTITYSVNKDDKAFLNKVASKTMTALMRDYDKAPERYSDDKNAIERNFKGIADAKATFALLERDGLASITKEKDEFYTFAEHAGDCYCPVTNDNIDKAELKKQERRERARFNRQGVFFHTLIVNGEELDSIGGFVGNDFYGSGYDTDFYRTAIDTLKVEYEPYFLDIQRALEPDGMLF